MLSERRGRNVWVCATTTVVFSSECHSLSVYPCFSIHESLCWWLSVTLCKGPGLFPLSPCVRCPPRHDPGPLLAAVSLPVRCAGLPVPVLGRAAVPPAGRPPGGEGRAGGGPRRRRRRRRSGGNATGLPPEHDCRLRWRRRRRRTAGKVLERCGEAGTVEVGQR